MRDDLLELVAAADRKGRWKYVDLHPLWAAERPRRTWTSLSDVPDLCVSPQGRSTDRPRILIVDRTTIVRERKYRVRGVGWRWSIANASSQRGVQLDPSGEFRGTLLHGTAGTLRLTPSADRIIRDLRGAIRRLNWTCVDRLFWFGPGALKLAHAGRRCAMDVTSPRTYDVVVP